MDIRTMAGLLTETYRFRQRDHGRRAQLKAYQTRALYRLRVHAYAHSPFYQRFHKNLMKRPFRELPVLTRAMLMEHRGLHILEDQIIFEVVDQHNRPVPLGAEGDKVLITTLFSRTLPLIRYELPDRVQLAMKPCSCGRPLALIAAVQGHTEDAVSFPTRAGQTVTIHPYVFHQLMDTVPASGWQIVQGAERVEVRLSGVCDGFDDAALAESLHQVLAAQGAHVPPIGIQRVPTIPESAPDTAPLIASRTNGSAPQAPARVLSAEVLDGRDREPDL